MSHNLYNYEEETKLSFNKLLKQFIIPLFFIIPGLYLQTLQFYEPGIIFILIGVFFSYYFSWLDSEILYYYPNFENRNNNEKWVEITDYELHNIRLIIQRYDALCAKGCFEYGVFSVIGAIVIIFYFLFLFYNYSWEKNWGTLALFVPMLLINSLIGVLWYYFNNPIYWMPYKIKFKLIHFNNLINLMKNSGIYNWDLNYQIKLDKTTKSYVPTDIKVILKPPHAPKEFYGVQAQISINVGLPYMYFVVVTNKSLPIAKPTNFATQLDVIEFIQEKEVNVLVIRQYTTNKSGYHTTNSDIVRLLKLVKISVDNTLGSYANV